MIPRRATKKTDVEPYNIFEDLDNKWICPKTNGSVLNVMARKTGSRNIF